MTDTTKYAAKIDKLLAKASSTNSTAEAEALLEKAQEWMTEYAIDEAMLAKVRGLESAEKIVCEYITYTGIFRDAMFDTGKVIAQANDCRVLIDKTGNITNLMVNGFEKDVARVKVLDSEAQIIASRALLRWQKEQDRSLYPGMAWYKARREFLLGFAMGLSTKLAGARANAMKTKQAEQSSGPSDSVEIVLRDKKARVDDWMDKTYGRFVKRSRRYSSGGRAARDAGHSAGLSANIGQGAVAGGLAGALGQ